MGKVGPALAALLDNAAATATVREDISAHDLLYAIADLCMPVPGEARGTTSARPAC